MPTDDIHPDDRPRHDRAVMRETMALAAASLIVDAMSALVQRGLAPAGPDLCELGVEAAALALGRLAEMRASQTGEDAQAVMDRAIETVRGGR